MRNRLVADCITLPALLKWVLFGAPGVPSCSLSLSPRWSRSSPQLAHSLPLSSLPLSTKVQGCLTPTPRFLYSTSSWFSWSPHCHCVFVVAALVPIPSSLIQAFFFPIDYYIISPSSQSCHNSSQDLLSSECWSHKWHLGKSIQTLLRFPKEPLSVPPFACLSCLHHPVPPCLPNSSSSKSELGHIFLQDFLTTFPLQAASFVSFVVSTIHISDDTCNLTEL